MQDPESKNQPFSVRLTSAQRAQLQALAQAEDRRPSEIIRRLIRTAYARLIPLSNSSYEEHVDG